MDGLAVSLGMISILPGIYGGIVSTENESDYQAHQPLNGTESHIMMVMRLMTLVL